MNERPPQTDLADVARVSVLVSAAPAAAFRLFTEHIDRWWRRGAKYRIAGRRPGIIHIEPHVGGRLFESFDSGSETTVIDTGRVIVWEPPTRLVFDWRAVNFAPSEWTQVEVTFEPTSSGTLVTVSHRGWGKIRSDHPVRHGLDSAAFLRMMGIWWADLMGSLRSYCSSEHSP